MRENQNVMAVWKLCSNHSRQKLILYTGVCFSGCWKRRWSTHVEILSFKRPCFFSRKLTMYISVCVRAGWPARTSEDKFKEGNYKSKDITIKRTIWKSFLSYIWPSYIMYILCEHVRVLASLSACLSDTVCLLEEAVAGMTRNIFDLDC